MTSPPLSDCLDGGAAPALGAGEGASATAPLGHAGAGFGVLGTGIAIPAGTGSLLCVGTDLVSDTARRRSYSFLRNPRSKFGRCTYDPDRRTVGSVRTSRGSTMRSFLGRPLSSLRARTATP